VIFFESAVQKPGIRAIPEWIEPFSFDGRAARMVLV